MRSALATFILTGITVTTVWAQGFSNENLSSGIGVEHDGLLMNDLLIATGAAKGVISNRDGIGAYITVTMPDTSMQYFEMRSGSNLGGGDSHMITFGLGNFGSILALSVKWPSGIVQVDSNITSNQKIEITERVHVWEGTVDSNWTNALNWDAGTVPDRSTYVLIPPGKVYSPCIGPGGWTIGDTSSSSLRACHDIWIEDNAVYTCGPETTVLNSGNVNIHGEIIVLNSTPLSWINLPGSKMIIKGSGALNFNH